MGGFAMKKCILVLAICLIVPNSVAAQDSDSPAALNASRFSIAAGIGFFAEDNFDGFLVNFGGLHHFDEKWSVGLDFQIGIEDDFTIFSMPFYGRYDFGNIPVGVPVLKDIHPFAKTGIGFTFAKLDTQLGNSDDTGFLFVIGGGVAYPVLQNLSLESTMLFNVTTNDFFDDDFYFTWEILSARVRF